MDIETFPSDAALLRLSRDLPDFMRPNTVPYAMVSKGYLTDEQCDAILAYAKNIEGYSYRGCNARTQEFSRPLDQVLAPIEEFARYMNSFFWEFDLDPEPAAWLQTYNPGDKYNRHMDMNPGQTRKLTAVALLTNRENYDGGQLVLDGVPTKFFVPRDRGTVVLFPSYIVHEVEIIVAGTRKSINMGFYGPQFR